MKIIPLFIWILSAPNLNVVHLSNVIDLWNFYVYCLNRMSEKNYEQELYIEKHLSESRNQKNMLCSFQGIKCYYSTQKNA